MESSEYLQALKRRWPIVVICALAAAVLAFVLTPAPKQRVSVVPAASQYRAENTMLVRNPGGVVGTIGFNQVPLFATTGEVPRRAAEKLGYTGPPAALASQVEVKIDAQTGTLTVSTQDSDPDVAVARADVFADELVAYLTEQQDLVRTSRLQTLLAQLTDLENNKNEVKARIAVDPTNELLQAQSDAIVRSYGATYEQYRAITLLGVEGVGLTTLERAQPVPVDTPGGSVIRAPQSRASRVPLAAVAGAMLGLGIVFLIERLDGRVRSRRRAEQAYGAPVVAELPSFARALRGHRLLVSPQSRSVVAEAYRTLRASVTFLAQANPGEGSQVGVILVTSASSGEGKTTTAANLAAAFAETGKSVVVVNADFRKPSLAKFLPGVRRPSIPEDLSDLQSLRPESLLAETGVAGLRLLDLARAGANPGDLARITVRCVEALRTSVDVIVIDTSPLSLTAEALEFVPDATVGLLMARVGRTSVAQATRAAELMRFGDASQVAVVLTDAGRPSRRRYTYYGYHEPTELRPKPPTPGDRAEDGRSGRPIAPPSVPTA